MPSKSTIYNWLPDFIKPLAKREYYRVVHGKTDAELHSEFIDKFFHSESEYNEYIDEFEDGPAVDIRNEGLQKYQKLTKSNGLSGIGLDTAQDFYAIARKLEPATVIETGVCNGVSTLSILLALQKNETGKLYSIDYPLRADEPLEEFRQETFKNYGGAVIPSDKNPGWIIPDELRSRWELTIGKSQRELPKLITRFDEIDMFAHDSEHSHPCMMFEFELAFEWLKKGGVIVSDDITWNDAFSIFTSIRDPDHGRLSHTVGYIRK